MIKGKRVLCLIAARGGSKGLPGKNIMNMLGKPLIAYTIEQAKRSKYIDRTIVTTDSQEIAKIARHYGAETPFLRPARLATDTSSGLDVLLHAIDWLKKEEGYAFDILVELQVTAPLREVSDIDQSIKLLVDQKADNVFSVVVSGSNPYFNMVEEKGRSRRIGLVKTGRYLTRQSAPRVYEINGSIYVWWETVFRQERSLFLKNSRIYVMPRERSLDIDDLFDFRLVETLMTSNWRTRQEK